ncbi:NAD(P)-binding protein [Xylariaceae sp. FL0255]|nr:NAD(P)-binding protein [Xylariaceae sp. FL0255]
MAEIEKLRSRLASTGSYPPVPPDWGADFTKITRTDTYDYIDPETRSDCTGKAVLITGGTKGIGLGIAVSYARAGASQIAITSRSVTHDGVITAVAQIRKAGMESKRSGQIGPKVLAIALDVKDITSVKQAARTLEAKFGRLDVLIENAGFLARYENILDGDEDEWWESFDVNLRGGYLVAKAFLPLLLRDENATEGCRVGDKTVIFISSTGALHFHPGGSAYQISKFALLRLVEFLLSEYSNQGLLAYSVHPGGVATDLASRLPQRTQSWLKCTPALGGDTIAFLTSSRQEWLAGRYLTAMWDMSEFFSKKAEIIDKDLLKMRMTFS